MSSRRGSGRHGPSPAIISANVRRLFSMSASMKKLLRRMSDAACEALSGRMVEDAPIVTLERNGNSQADPQPPRPRLVAIVKVDRPRRAAGEAAPEAFHDAAERARIDEIGSGPGEVDGLEVDERQRGRSARSDIAVEQAFQHVDVQHVGHHHRLGKDDVEGRHQPAGDHRLQRRAEGLGEDGVVLVEEAVRRQARKQVVVAEAAILAGLAGSVRLPAR